jgi:hypothetical protein
MRAAQYYRRNASVTCLSVEGTNGQKRLFRGLGATHCADRNRYARGGIRRGKHVATSVENSAGIDDHARRVYFSGDDALGLNFDAALGKNYPIEAAGDDDAIAFNLSFDFGIFTEDYSLLGNDVALHVAVDAKSAGDLKSALQGHALVNKAGPFFGGRGARS